MFFRGCGEMAERSKALDWNSSNIFTGVPGFESLSLRQNMNARPCAGFFIYPLRNCWHGPHVRRGSGQQKAPAGAGAWRGMRPCVRGDSPVIQRHLPGKSERYIPGCDEQAPEAAAVSGLRFLIKESRSGRYLAHGEAHGRAVIDDAIGPQPAMVTLDDQRRGGQPHAQSFVILA